MGCGNDFLLFDTRYQDFPHTHTDLMKRLCHRHYGIGADGILLLESSARADVRMRIFNADGSEAEMCGNGIRCFVAWLQHLGFNQSVYSIETMHRIITAQVKDSLIYVDMGVPQDLQWELDINFLDQSVKGHYLNTGVPHVVVLVDQLENVDVNHWGAALRHHVMWKPQGVNANFVQILSKQKIKVRTFERGVEKETLACGTGATAAALVVAYLENWDAPIQVETHSKENLTISFMRTDQSFSKVEMAGSAFQVFEGKVDLNQWDFCVN